MRFVLAALVAVVVSLLVLSRPAHAGWRADVEIDPTAYVLSGYSLHAGLSRDRLRVDLGAFAIAVPELVHGQDGFDQAFDGYGVKLQYFLFGERSGGFVGVDGGVARVLVQRRGTDLASRGQQITVGVNFGWRFELGPDFYASVWLGLGYAFGADDVTLGGATFEANPITVFPAVHVGRRF